MHALYLYIHVHGCCQALCKSVNLYEDMNLQGAYLVFVCKGDLFGHINCTDSH